MASFFYSGSNGGVSGWSTLKSLGKLAAIARTKRKQLAPDLLESGPAGHRHYRFRIRHWPIAQARDSDHWLEYLRDGRFGVSPGPRRAAGHSQPFLAGGILRLPVPPARLRPRLKPISAALPGAASQVQTHRSYHPPRYRNWRPARQRVFPHPGSYGASSSCSAARSMPPTSSSMGRTSRFKSTWSADRVSQKAT